MSEGFAQRVAEMTAAWQPFKASLGEGFEQIYSTMHGIADKIIGVTIPAVNELTSALSKVASEITSIVKAGELNVKVETSKSSSSWFSWSSSRAERHAAGGIFSRPMIFHSALKIAKDYGLMTGFQQRVIKSRQVLLFMNGMHPIKQRRYLAEHLKPKC